MHGAPCRGAKELGGWRPQLGGHALQQLPKCMQHIGRSLHTQHVPEGKAQHKQKDNTQHQDRQVKVALYRRQGQTHTQTLTTDNIKADMKPWLCLIRSWASTCGHPCGNMKPLKCLIRGGAPNLRPPMQQHGAIDIFDKGWPPTCGHPCNNMGN